MSNIVFARNDGIFEMLKWKNDAKISNDADLIYKQGGTMAYIKKKSERKFKITVCNGYKVNGQKRMKAQTITVPSSVPKRGIQQYVMAEAVQTKSGYCLLADWGHPSCKAAPHDFRGNVRGIAQAPRTWWKLHQGNYCAEISGNCFLGAGRCKEK